jgi:hypothetical protein
VGWDGDPWSRLRTALRHQRFPPWVFTDATGAFEELAITARRAARESWSGRWRKPEKARARLAGLLPSLGPRPEVLRAWIAAHRPGSILAANLMGQFAPLAERVIERAFKPMDPWEPDPDLPDPLAEETSAWSARVVTAFLETLKDSGAELWMLHDRAVLEKAPLLGPWQEDWTRQIAPASPGVPLELFDPLGGVDVLAAVGKPPLRAERWLWPVGPGQIHLVEALAFS